METCQQRPVEIRSILAFLAVLILPLLRGFAATPTFSEPVPGRVPDPVFTTALGPAVADFNGDTFLDIVSVDAAGSSIFLSLGNADGTNNAKVTMAGPTKPVAVLAADLNADQEMDLVIATETEITYILNDGGMPFPFSATPVTLPLTVRCVGLAVGDFNQDGYPDIIVSGDADNGMGQTIGKVEVRKSKVTSGAFDGYFSGTLYDAGASASRVTVGDLNGDGYPDVALARTAPAEAFGDVTIYFGNPNNLGSPTTFLATPAQTIPLTHNPLSITIGDITEDGKPDVVTTAYVRPTGGGPLVLSFVELIRNLADDPATPHFAGGEFLFFDYATSGSVPFSDVKVGDIDGDTVPDIAVIDQEGVKLHVIRVSPVLDENSAYKNLNKDAEDVFPINGAPNQLALADLNGDQYLDVVVAHGLQGGLTTLLNTTAITDAGPVAKAIQFATGTYTANEGFPAPVDVVVKRATDSTGAVTVKFSVTGTATPNGSPHSDFALADPPPDKAPLKPGQNTATLTFAAGEFEKHITLFISQDPGSEPDETIILSLQTPTGDAVLGAPRVATVTIKDSEPPALVGGNKLTIKPSKPLKLIPSDKPAGVKLVGRTPDPWTFTTTETKDAKLPGLALKVQYSLTAPPNEMWVDLPDGAMSRPGNKGTKWVATSYKVPDGATVFFRTVSNATDRVSGSGRVSPPCRVVASPFIKVTMQAVPGNNAFSAQKAYPEEDLAYKVSYQNTGTVPANNVTIAVQIPTHTHSDNGGGSVDIQTLTEGSASESFLAYFDLGTVPAGASGFRIVNTIVDSDALDGKGPKETVTVGFVEGGSKKFDKGLNSFAARKKVSGDAVYGAVWDDPVPATKPKSLYSTGGAVETRIEHPIDLKVTAAQTIAQRGDVIEYEVKVNNNSGQLMQNVKFNAYVPSGTTLESVHQSDGNGNFDMPPPIIHPTPGGNPAVPVFQFGQPRLLTWTIGELPTSAQRTIKYAVRILYDVTTDFYDSKGVLHTAEIDNVGSQIPALDNNGKVLKFKGQVVTETVDPFITANRVSSKAFKVAPEKTPRTLLSAIDPDSLPQPGLSREARGEGQGMGELKVKGVKGLPAEKEVEVETVLPGDDVTYTMHFWNTGNASKPAALARSCIIQDELPDGVTLKGEFKLGKTSPVDIAINDPMIVLRDQDGVVLPLPGHTLTADLPKVRVMEFRIGDLAAGAESQISYKVQPNLKAGDVLLSKGYQIWTESLSQPVLGEEVAAVKAVLPISFTHEINRMESEPAHPGQELHYTVKFRNNGGFTASNVSLKIAIPEGTTYNANSGVTLDARVPVTVDSSKSDTLVFTTPTLHASEETSTADPAHPDESAVAFTLKVKSQGELPEKLKLPGSRFPVHADVSGFYPSGAVAKFAGLRSFRAGFVTDPGGTPKPSGITRDTLFTKLEVDQTKLGPVLWAYKRAPQYVKPGQKMVYEMTYGNSGDATIGNPFVTMVIPRYCTFDAANSTTGADTRDLASVSWRLGDLLPHTKHTVFIVFDLAANAVFPGGNLVQDTAYVISDSFKIFNGKELVSIAVAPGPVVTKVYKNHATASAWDSFTAGLSALGASIFGKGNAQVEESVHEFGDDSVVTSMRGADALILPNALIIQNGGGNIVAAGGGNIVAAGGGNIVAAGGGNIVAAGGGNVIGQSGSAIVAAGGGNIVAAGGGNLISVQGIGLCTQANLLTKINGIVAGGSGNIVAAGGGNLVRLENGVAHLIGLDGASLRDTGGNLITIPAKSVNIVAAGGGNIVAAGGGNIVAAGGGNIQAALLSAKEGFVTIPNEAGVFHIGGNPIPDIATVVANDGAGLIGNDASNLLGNDASRFTPVAQ